MNVTCYWVKYQSLIKRSLKRYQQNDSKMSRCHEITYHYSWVESRLFNRKVTQNSPKKWVQTVTFWLQNWTLSLVTLKWSSSNSQVIWLVDNRLPTPVTNVSEWMWLWSVTHALLAINLKMTEQKSFRICQVPNRALQNQSKGLHAQGSSLSPFLPSTG